MVTELEAIAIAKGYAKQQCWPWLEPVISKLRIRLRSTREYEVRTNADCRGTNVVIVIDAQNGAVLKARFIPR